MNNTLPAAVLVGALILGGGFAVLNAGDVEHRGGWVEATAASDTPPDVTPVDVNNSTVAESELLLQTIRNATLDGEARTALPSERSYQSVTRALPEESYYEGASYESGFYVRYDDQLVRINTGELA